MPFLASHLRQLFKVWSLKAQKNFIVTTNSLRNQIFLEDQKRDPHIVRMKVILDPAVRWSKFEIIRQKLIT